MSPLDLSLCRQDKWGRRSECYSPCVIPAPESALGSHPCGALSSAQVTSAYNRKTQSPFSPECVNHVPGTKCKRCPGLDTSSAASSIVLQTEQAGRRRPARLRRPAPTLPSKFGTLSGIGLRPCGEFLKNSPSGKLSHKPKIQCFRPFRGPNP